MFNNSNGYSLADIAAATGGNNRNDIFQRLKANKGDLSS